MPGLGKLEFKDAAQGIIIIDEQDFGVRFFHF
jgi:hypothetical protein